MKQRARKIYIAGKITGDEFFMKKFRAAEVDLQKARKHCEGLFQQQCHECVFYDTNYTTMCRINKALPRGINVVNPSLFNINGKPWFVCMVVCLWHLMWCHYVYMLHDWQESRGARVEHRWAQRLGKQIIYQRSAFVPLVEEEVNENETESNGN